MTHLIEQRIKSGSGRLQRPKAKVNTQSPPRKVGLRECSLNKTLNQVYCLIVDLQYAVLQRALILTIVLDVLPLKGS